MAARHAAAVVLVAALAALPAGGHSATSPASVRTATAAEARRVVTTFFTTLNRRKYERTCALLANAYFERTPGSSRRTCAAGLRAAFIWSQEIRWRITRVRATAGRVRVDTVADGAPGTIVLVRERSRLRILALRDQAS